MHTRSATRLLLATACTALAACRSEVNDRTTLGAPGAASAVRLSDIHGAGQRAETPRSDDATSLAGLSRASWTRQTVEVPVEGTYALRRYTRTYHMTETTSRQRGEFPTPMSTLELTGDTGNEQALEALVSGPYALYEGVVLIPRLFFVRPCEEIRATPEEHWRAPVSTMRFTAEQRAAATAAQQAQDPAAAPR